MSDFDPDKLHHDMVEAGHAFADAQAAADALEEAQKSVKSQLFIEMTGTVAEREALALSAPTYKAHVRDMIDAKRKANIARVNYDAIKVYIELLRTQQSNRRAEMALR